MSGCSIKVKLSITNYITQVRNSTNMTFLPNIIHLCLVAFTEEHSWIEKSNPTFLGIFHKKACSIHAWFKCCLPILKEISPLEPGINREHYQTVASYFFLEEGGNNRIFVKFSSGFFRVFQSGDGGEKGGHKQEVLHNIGLYSCSQ